MPKYNANHPLPQVVLTHMTRASGLLLHPTSLPSPFGIGDLGNEARAFIDFLHEAGQSFWQILPLTPTGYGDSPYQSISAFAGNTLLIDPRVLVDEGLLDRADLANSSIDCDRVDFEAARSVKTNLLGQAFENFRQQKPAIEEPFNEFCAQASWWLDDYALFNAAKRSQGNRQWTAWDRQLANHDPEALAQAQLDLANEITREKFYQFLFFRQWNALRDYARQRNVRLIGDLPIFVAHDSADVWAHRELFKLDDEGQPLVVAGVPPDYFSATGQLWGNPIYDWERLRADDFKWWIDRLRWSCELFELVRIDHFRGFAACWEIPAGDRTAENGQWVEAPGRELFTALKKTLGDLPIIAENLGVITPEVENLREEFGFPGMRVLQFAFGGDATNDHLPHRHTRDSVVYTGTHDNDTTVGWFSELGEKERAHCLSYLATDGGQINWDMIRAAMASVADLAILPLQDVLGLGNEARMNLPASEQGNWNWRMKPDVLNGELSTRLRDLTTLYGRIK
jgi:4-alpha-glucanotransferase